MTCTPASGNLFVIGTTAVTCSATDGTGNSAHVDFSVTVQATSTPAPATPTWLALLLGLSLLGLATRAAKTRHC